SSFLLCMFPAGYVRHLQLMIDLGTSVLGALQERKNSLRLLVLRSSHSTLSVSRLNQVLLSKRIHITVLLDVCASFFWSFVLLRRRELLATFYFSYYSLVVVLLIMLLADVGADNIFSGSRNTISLIVVGLGSFFLIVGFSKG